MLTLKNFIRAYEAIGADTDEQAHRYYEIKHSASRARTTLLELHRILFFCYAKYEGHDHGDITVNFEHHTLRVQTTENSITVTDTDDNGVAMNWFIDDEDGELTYTTKPVGSPQGEGPSQWVCEHLCP